MDYRGHYVKKKIASVTINLRYRITFAPRVQPVTSLKIRIFTSVQIYLWPFDLENYIFLHAFLLLYISPKIKILCISLAWCNTAAPYVLFWSFKVALFVLMFLLDWSEHLHPSLIWKKFMTKINEICTLRTTIYNMLYFRWSVMSIT